MSRENQLYHKFFSAMYRFLANENWTLEDWRSSGSQRKLGRMTAAKFWFPKVKERCTDSRLIWGE